MLGFSLAPISGGLRDGDVSNGLYDVNATGFRGRPLRLNTAHLPCFDDKSVTAPCPMLGSEMARADLLHIRRLGFPEEGR